MRTTMMVAALALAVGAAGAREAVAQENLLGVKAGFVSANVDEDGADARTSLGFGGFARFGLAPRLSVQPEALYVGKGFGDETDGIDATFELDYLQIPVLLQYHVPVEGDISPRLFAGPALAFNLGCDVSGGDGSTSVSLSCDAFSDFGVDLEARTVELALVFGGGVDIAAGSTTVTLDGRYDMGLSDVLEIEGVSGLKNRAWELFAGVGFPFGQ
jgi:hypothetical protein